MGTPSATEGSGRWRQALAPAATFAVLLAVYAATLCPTVFTSPQATDSGELITAIHVLGVSHPTGYPLYMLLGRLFEAIVPVGEVAFRLNLLSAVLAAAAGALICRAIVLAGGSRAAGVLGGLSGGLFSIVWGQSVYAEVYALNMLLVALALVAFCRWQRLRTSSALVWLAAAAGLGLAHHRTALFISGPLLVAALVQHRPLGPRVMAKGAAAFLAPLLLYAYLPLRAAANPPANWGAADTWAGFWHHVSGALYAPYVFARRGAELGSWVSDALLGAAGQIGWVGLVFVLFGAVWAVRRRPPLGIALAVGCALTFVWSATYAAGDAAVFVIPCYQIMGWWLAEAAHATGRALGRLGPGSARLARAGGYVAPALMILLPLRLVTGNWRDADARSAWQGDEWARTVFAQFVPDSLVLLTGDAGNGIAQYFQAVKGERRDVLILSADHANHQWYARQIEDARLRRAVTDAVRRDMRAVRQWREGIIKELPTWQGTLAHHVATQYPERLPMHTNFPVPALPAGYWVEDRTHLGARGPLSLFTISDTPPRLLEPDPPGAEATPLEFGISLLAAKVERDPLQRGRAAPVWLRWRCEKRVETPLSVAVSLVAADLLDVLDTPPRAEIPTTPGGFSVTTPLVSGLTPLAPTPPGRHYLQEVYVVPPRLLVPARYRIRVALLGEGWVSQPVVAGEVAIE